MRRVPIFASLVVLLAVLTMVGLGFWQIRRAHWKEGLLVRYQAGARAPALNGLPVDMTIDDLSFRQTRLLCRIVTPILQLGGANAAGQTGFRNIAGCRLDDGRTIMADIGWSAINSGQPEARSGLQIEAAGRLIPDTVLAGRIFGDRSASIMPLLIVLDRPVSGLEPSVAPSIADIPNNHRAYAAQWFLFAVTALIIYALALRRRYKARS
jgi:cytochrome oxidase assembly protein ShyY1